MRINFLFEKLEKKYKWRGWWPSTPEGKKTPEYHKSKKYKYTDNEKFEIAVGAILTQNTAWTNVIKALENLNFLGVNLPEKLLKTEEDLLLNAIKPSGYYNQKLKKIKCLSEFFIKNSFKTLNKKNAADLRFMFLNIWGIGRETADSIILYVFNKPIFVIDAYTRRVLKRNGIIEGNEDYDEIRELVENNIPHNVNKYKNYHAVIVELCKQYCKTNPDCKNCILNEYCIKNIKKI